MPGVLLTAIVASHRCYHRPKDFTSLPMEITRYSSFETYPSSGKKPQRNSFFNLRVFPLEPLHMKLEGHLIFMRPLYTSCVYLPSFTILCNACKWIIRCQKNMNSSSYKRARKVFFAYKYLLLNNCYSFFSDVGKTVAPHGTHVWLKFAFNSNYSPQICYLKSRTLRISRSYQPGSPPKCIVSISKMASGTINREAGA